MIFTNAPENVARTLGRFLGYQDTDEIVFFDVDRLDERDYDPTQGRELPESRVLLLVLPDDMSVDARSRAESMLRRTGFLWESTWLYHAENPRAITMVGGRFSTGMMYQLNELVGAIDAHSFAVKLEPFRGYGYYAECYVSASTEQAKSFSRPQHHFKFTGEIQMYALVPLFPVSIEEARYFDRRIAEQNDESREAGYGAVETCTQMLTEDELARFRELNELTSWS